MPPLHPIFGHLLVLAQMRSKLPKDAEPHYLAHQFRQVYPELGPIFYIDAWPIISLMLIVASPSTTSQVATERALPKGPTVSEFLYPLTKGRDIVSMDGDEWKMWRGIFNAGFSYSHLMTLAPDIVKKVEVFCKMLGQHTEKQDIFPFKNMTDNLTVDVIGKVVL